MVHVDYSVYLVTDNTPAILGDKNIVDVVRAAVEGGVTIVQLRDKTSDTGEMIRIAKELHAVTKPAGIPLVINDRVDVALAAGVEGVHIGQDDIDLASARRILGKDAIIGVTANTLEEAETAAKGGAEYLGIGTVFATATKENSKSIIGVSGLQSILASLAKSYPDVQTVCIGGINAKNCQRVLYQSATPEKKLDGIAIVSAIMAASDPQKAASDLVNLVKTPPPFATQPSTQHLSKDSITSQIPALTKALAARKPLCHNMTNLVVQNFAANVALAVGSSPIMSNDVTEAADLAALNGSLVINMGTATPEMRANHIGALAAYNSAGRPVLLDPVGAGATASRKRGVHALLAGGYFTCIKGNEGEIRTIFAAKEDANSVKQHGVDSGAAVLSLAQRAKLVRDVAAREKNIVLLTGETDVLSDGHRTLAVSNGHELLGEITGSGCTLGTTIASYLAIAVNGRDNGNSDVLVAVLAGLLHYEIAGERAAARESVKGPGSFVPAFIDELFLIRKESVGGDETWIKDARVEVLDVE